MNLRADGGGDLRLESVPDPAPESNEAIKNVVGILDESSARVAAMRGRIQSEGGQKQSRGGKVVAFDAYPSVPSIYTDVANRAVTAVTDPAQLRFGG